MGTVSNANLYAGGGSINLYNEGLIGETKMTAANGGNITAINDGYMQNTKVNVNTWQQNTTGTVNIANNGEMGKVCSTINGAGSNFNFANNGFTTQLGTSTYHGGVTNILNTEDGWINKACLYDSKDKTNVENQGGIGQLGLTGYWQGEFNVHNASTGYIGELTTGNLGTKPGSLFNIDNDGAIMTANLNSQGGSVVNFNNFDGFVSQLNGFADGNNSKLNIVT